ncbi:nuclear transport factor 2 family protein [Bradyrhizobium sp. U87765 SZCCT0131]|uniref:nuclear transport factor 2 family protein n=1 Tax=unclassified Bradyrhizobium TaxID=2631580 RepID=UPI001BAADC47|nr:MULTISPECIES: nuclear transport factor 2 family protein [unclassified Bradyrhizobium]MBR1218068.1 nuclear transport factor 2 family protein [Bradyrhizobium sp. U87765 SZCCT0131]MBR1260986.1 nuclear transport factor 2 family protein [Bradyrhizobium sp. U87765 SZCCT0134]MBR1303566.1 nuclear transport factor 2 family protein [Bradyrhizobium sp. U87765 SZCCT0110]MBR1319172.1 nuclear transport factor 2 family protein [Bradyrhizobium sp. U87765 SZCCT0109]MBR1347497.1 nuclear transport factor 2 fa
MSTDDDVTAIAAVIARQFDSLSWRDRRGGDWDAFAADFLPGAVLVAAARPAAVQSVEAFVARMQSLAAGELHTLQETVLGQHIRVFGNIAIAAIGCGMVENGAEQLPSVEMMLLVRTDGVWRIVAQAWDKVGDGRPLPDDLAGLGSSS